MNIDKTQTITVETTINAPIEKVWDFWTKPEHICNWNFASESWHNPSAENDLVVGGKFSYRMEAKDGSFGFDYWGVYEKITINRLIEFVLGDNRRVQINFLETGNLTRITETFEAEFVNAIELQRTGWQAILDNFKKYVEAS
jgi:uncharacterized protein YndB with AHSA1/START domain